MLYLKLVYIVQFYLLYTDYCLILLVNEYPLIKKGGMAKGNIFIYGCDQVNLMEK